MVCLRLLPTRAHLEVPRVVGMHEDVHLAPGCLKVPRQRRQRLLQREIGRHCGQGVARHWEAGWRPPARMQPCPSPPRLSRQRSQSETNTLNAPPRGTRSHGQPHGVGTRCRLAARRQRPATQSRPRSPRRQRRRRPAPLSFSPAVASVETTPSLCAAHRSRRSRPASMRPTRAKATGSCAVRYRGSGWDAQLRDEDLGSTLPRHTLAHLVPPLQRFSPAVLLQLTEDVCTCMVKADGTSLTGKSRMGCGGRGQARRRWAKRSSMPACPLRYALPSTDRASRRLLAASAARVRSMARRGAGPAASAASHASAKEEMLAG